VVSFVGFSGGLFFRRWQMKEGCEHEWREYLGKDGLIADCRKCGIRVPVTEEKSLTEHLFSLWSVREEYREMAGEAKAEAKKKHFLAGVAEKDEQIAVAVSALPYNLYSTEELVGFAGLEALPELWFPEIRSGGDWLPGALFPIRVAWMGVGMAKWAVWEPTELPIDLIEPHPLNGLIYAGTDISVLVEQIRQSGWVKPLVIDRRRRAISGNSRLAAGKILALPTLPIAEIIAPMDESAAIERLILENAARVKTIEQRVREAQILQDVPGWLEEIREKRQRKILTRAIEWLEERGDERVGELASLSTEEGWKLFKSWEIGELKVSRSFHDMRKRDLIAESAGLGSGENYRKALKVVKAIDFFASIARRVEAESLREALDKSVEAAYKLLSDIEKKEREGISYRYSGAEIQGVAHLLQPGDICIPAAIDLTDKDRQAIRLEYAEEVFFVLRRDLEIVGLEEKEEKPSKEAAKTESKLGFVKKPIPVAYAVGDRVVRPDNPARVFLVRVIDGTIARIEEVGKDYRESSHHSNYVVAPSLAVGDTARFILRDRMTGRITGVQWGESHGCWIYNLLRNDGKADSALEANLEPIVVDDLAIGDWVSDGGSVGIVEAIDPFVVRWLGMGSDPAPRSVTGEADPAILKPFEFDPFAPPKRVIAGFQIGDRVSPHWDKERVKRGRIGARSGDYVDIDWDAGILETSQLRPDQLALVEYAGYGLGDRADADLKGAKLAGEIVALYRHVADLKLEDGRKCRIPYEWLKPTFRIRYQ
jgi:hypothetical protein